MKKIIIISITLILVAAIGLTLSNNKQKLAAKTQQEKKQTEFPVIISKVTMGILEEGVSVIGTTIANNDVMVQSETIGKVVKVNFNEGSYVSKGTVLAVVDDEIKLTNLKLAEANYEKAKKDLERHENLFKQKSIPESQFDAIKLAFQNAETQFVVANRQFEDTKIKSPINGIVTSKLVDIGYNLGINTPIANVVDVSSLKVKLNLSERDAFKLKVGDQTSITTDVYSKVKFEGKVESISVKGDMNHTYPVEIKIQNQKEHPLKIGMFAKVNFVSIKPTESIIIPREAIIGGVKSPSVFVENVGVVSQRKIILGSEYQGKVEILGGLKEGENIVVSGQNNLRDGFKVIVAEKGI